MSGAPGDDGAGLVRLGIRVRGDRAEIALAALLPLLRGGAEETDPGDGTVEYGLYAPADALPSPAAVRALAGDAVLDLAVSDVPAGWERRWHAHLRPVEVVAGARRVRVRPPWAPPAADGAALDIVVDPGDSFGAGGHASTQLCLELLLELEPDGALCDWGAGSGVLALAAARLGWDPVHAVELDPRAVATIRANADANGLDVHAHRLDLTAAAAAPWAPSVCANLTLELLGAAAARAASRAPERMIASGVLSSQADAAAAALAGLGLSETRRRVRDGWAALHLERA